MCRQTMDYSQLLLCISARCSDGSAGLSFYRNGFVFSLGRYTWLTFLLLCVSERERAREWMRLRFPSEINASLPASCDATRLAREGPSFRISRNVIRLSYTVNLLCWNHMKIVWRICAICFTSLSLLVSIVRLYLFLHFSSIFVSSVDIKDNLQANLLQTCTMVMNFYGVTSALSPSYMKQSTSVKSCSDRLMYTARTTQNIFIWNTFLLYLLMDI